MGLHVGITGVRKPSRTFPVVSSREDLRCRFMHAEPIQIPLSKLLSTPDRGWRAGRQLSRVKATLHDIANKLEELPSVTSSRNWR